MVDYAIYRAFVLLHLLGVMAFLLSHGVSVGVAFKLRTERRKEHVAALLSLSAESTFAMVLSFLFIIAVGLTTGYLGDWFGAGWFWASLVLFFALSLPMTPMATAHYSKVRRSLGVPGPRFAPKAASEPVPPMTDEEIDAELKKVNAWGLTAVGFGGLAVLMWLMMFKPF